MLTDLEAKITLRRLGYLPGNPLNPRDEVLRHSVGLFQKYYSLKTDGILNGETKEALSRPRCFFPDKNFVEREEFMSAEILLAGGRILSVQTRAAKGDIASVFGIGWPGVNKTFTLYYEFRSGTSPDFCNAVIRAMERWQRVDDGNGASSKKIVEFQPATAEHPPDLKIGWFVREDGVEYELGGNALAKAFPPPPSKPSRGEPIPVEFDGEASWSKDGGDPDKFTIEAVATHEIGHILGLAHPLDTIKDSTMSPIFSEGQDAQEISEDAIATLRELYPI